MINITELSFLQVGQLAELVTAKYFFAPLYMYKKIEIGKKKMLAQKLTAV